MLQKYVHKSAFCFLKISMVSLSFHQLWFESRWIRFHCISWNVFLIHKIPAGSIRSWRAAPYLSWNGLRAIFYIEDSSLAFVFCISKKKPWLTHWFRKRPLEWFIMSSFLKYWPIWLYVGIKLRYQVKYGFCLLTSHWYSTSYSWNLIFDSV